MLQMPPELKTGFDALPVEKGIPSGSHPDYRKGLRYCLGYSRKYGFERYEMSSLFVLVFAISRKQPAWTTRSGLLFRPDGLHLIGTQHLFGDPAAGVDHGKHPFAEIY
jgi:hypothetical protein